MSQYKYKSPTSNTQSLQDTKGQTISEAKFTDWSQNHLFRTSYGDHWTKRPQPPKNVVYPGYAGYIPGSSSENQHGKGYSPIARDCFNSSKLGENKHRLSSTGFNFRRTDFVDHALDASCHKYGFSTLQKPHPNWHVAKWESTEQTSFKDPKKLTNPTYRETNRFLQTQKLETRQSGFQQNHTYFDGTGWVPDKVLHGERVNSEYRLRYNPDVPFHRDTNKFKVRKLGKKEYTYKYM